MVLSTFPPVPSYPIHFKYTSTIYKLKAGINEAEEYVLGDRLLEAVAALQAREPETLWLSGRERGIENCATLSQNVKIRLCFGGNLGMRIRATE